MWSEKFENSWLNSKFFFPKDVSKPLINYEYCKSPRGGYSIQCFSNTFGKSFVWEHLEVLFPWIHFREHAIWQGTARVLSSMCFHCESMFPLWFKDSCLDVYLSDRSIPRRISSCKHLAHPRPLHNLKTTGSHCFPMRECTTSEAQGPEVNLTRCPHPKSNSPTIF